MEAFELTKTLIQPLEQISNDREPTTTCITCQRPILQDSPETINFGDGWFHPECFCCTVCSTVIDSDNQAICMNCSLKCRNCEKPILEEAISTGQHAYHTSCFKCELCSNLIENLTFAIVEEKLFCMDCHKKEQSISKDTAPPSENNLESLETAREEYIQKLEWQFDQLKAQIRDYESKNYLLNDTINKLKDDLIAVMAELQAEKSLRQSLEQTILTTLSSPPKQTDDISSNVNFSVPFNVESVSCFVKEETEKLHMLKLEVLKVGLTKDALVEEIKKLELEKSSKQTLENFLSNTQIEDFLATKTQEEFEIKKLRDKKELLQLEVQQLAIKSITLEKQQQQKHLPLPLQLKKQKPIPPPSRGGTTPVTNTTSSNNLLAKVPGEASSVAPTAPPTLSSSLKTALNKNKSTEKLNVKSPLVLPPATTTAVMPLKKAVVSTNTKLKVSSDGNGVVAKHTFLVHTYVKQIKCDACQEKLWGKEKRCQDCGYHCHTKCLNSVISQACRSVKSAQNLDRSFNLGNGINEQQLVVFGTPLQKLLDFEHGKIPNIVKKCIAEVESRGMDFEGIYRKSGPLTQINKIIASVNKGEDIDFGLDEVDIMAVTSVVKQYFRDLPNPLVPFDLYQEFMDASHDDVRIKIFQTCISKLPKENYDTLKFLMEHLSRIITFSTVNLMTSGNLGVVFGPTLMKPFGPISPQQDIAESGTKSYCIEFILRNRAVLFVDDEIAPPVVIIAGVGQKLGLSAASDQSELTNDEAVDGSFKPEGGFVSGSSQPGSFVSGSFKPDGFVSGSFKPGSFVSGFV